jgi:protein phosphatase
MRFPDRKPRDDELDSYGLSHPGKVRAVNEDHFLLATIHKQLRVTRSNLPDLEAGLSARQQRLASVAMVADGVGGGPGGAEASAIALEEVLRYVDGGLAAYYGGRGEEGEFGELLQAAALKAHRAVQQRRAARGDARPMATTLTLYIGVWPAYYLMQVGDSRYYVYRDARLEQVTRDQTIAQDLVDDGVLTRESARRTRFANTLSSTIGGDTSAPVVTRREFHWGNVHLLCSDGLTRHVGDARIAEVLGTMTSAQQACEQLVQDALDGGGTDNVTVVVARTVPREPAA